MHLDKKWQALESRMKIGKLLPMGRCSPLREERLAGDKGQSGDMLARILSNLPRLYVSDPREGREVS